jgi:hypothetical protein
MTTAEAPAAPAVVTPWMTVEEAAPYLRRHKKTVYALLRKYERTGGREGLKGGQPDGPNTKWFVHIADADRFMRGERPARPSRTARAA